MLDYVTLDTVPLEVTNAVGLAGLSGSSRGDTFDRPEADGVVEPENLYKPAKPIVLQGESWSNTQPNTVAGALAAFRIVTTAFDDCVQTAKLLKWRWTGDIDLQQTVRLIDAQPPVIDGGSMGPFYSYQVAFRSAWPYAESQTSQSAAASAPTSGSGMPLPIIFPIPFGTASGGTASVRNGGNAKAWPTLTITGPVIGPVVGNQTTGKYLYFDTLSLGAGETLVIETRPDRRTALGAGASKLGALRFVDSIWPSMTPLVTETWQFYGLGGGYTGATGLTIAWRDAYSA